MLGLEMGQYGTVSHTGIFLTRSQARHLFFSKKYPTGMSQGQYESQYVPIILNLSNNVTTRVQPVRRYLLGLTVLFQTT